MHACMHACMYVYIHTHATCVYVYTCGARLPVDMCVVGVCVLWCNCYFGPRYVIVVRVKGHV